MGSTLWFIIVGVLLIVAVVTRSFAERLSLSMPMFYLGVGVALGPLGLNLITLDAVQGSWYLERLTEVAVILSLFSAGLKLSPALTDRRWRVPVRLAFTSMTVTVVLIAAAGIWLLDLSPGAAILLGAVLAPTDPVLASDVQVKHPGDRDRLRFSLTGEAGLNDGTAFPFVMLGLGLLGLHELGAFGWRWLAVDVVWATFAGLGVGGILGWLISHLVIYLRTRHREAVGLDEFLSLGLIALAYGLALALHGYGFLAVFAAGLALRRVERQAGIATTAEVENAAAEGQRVEIATDPKTAPAYMAEAVLGFNEKIEHIGEFVVMVFVGAVLYPYLLALAPAQWWIIPLLFLAIRPAAVVIGLAGAGQKNLQTPLISWFGIRGLGSIYYLAYAIQHGLPFETAEPLTAVVLTVVTVSVVAHGLSVPSMMRWYRERTARAGRQR